MRRTIQIVFPMLLMGLGVYLLVGCIPVPGNFESDGAQRPDKRIGPADSDKPLKLGIANYDQVTGLLGVPWSASPDHAWLVYEFDVNDVDVLWPLCFSASRHFNTRWLLLAFSSDGRLQSFKT